MLAAIAVSGIASALCLRRLELDLKIPDHIFAGTEIWATVCVRNPRRWVPSLSISAVPVEKRQESKRGGGVATTFPVAPVRAPGRQWLQLPDPNVRPVPVGDASGGFRPSSSFSFIPPLAH